MSSQRPSMKDLLEAVVARLIDLALTPVRFAQHTFSRFVGVTAPTAFHLLVFFSLLPFIGLYSLGAGLLIRSWIPKGWRQVVYLQYGEPGLAPFANFDFPAFTADQLFEISLELVIPLFVQTTSLGNFMTSMAIVNPMNHTVAYSSRPSLIFPASFTSRALTLSGFQNTIPISVRLFEAFSLPSYAPGLRGRVSVGRADLWKSLGGGEGRELVVLESFVRVVPKTYGIRGFFVRHDLLLLAAATIAFFVASTIITVAVYTNYAPQIDISSDPFPPKRSGQITKSESTSRPEETLTVRQIKSEADGDEADFEDAALDGERAPGGGSTFSDPGFEDDGSGYGN